MATESRTGQPAVVKAVAPPTYDSLHPDETKQQPPPMAWPQGQVYQQPVDGPPPVQYVAAAPVGGPGYRFPTSVTAAAPIPPYKAPHDFFILAIITTFICAILNLLSLGFGIPAIIFSALTKSANSNGEYFKAKTYGRYSLTMTIVNILFTLCMALFITGLMVGCSYGYFRSGHYNYPSDCSSPYVSR